MDELHTHMHVSTHLGEEGISVTGIDLYPDGLVEGDGYLGMPLDKLEKCGIAVNTIVIYATDNSTEKIVLTQQ